MAGKGEREGEEEKQRRLLHVDSYFKKPLYPHTVIDDANS